MAPTQTAPLKKQRFISEKVAEFPPGHWSNVLRVGNHIWVSGHAARSKDLKTVLGKGSAYEQAKVTFGKIRDCLEAAGSSMADVTTMTIYVTNIADNKEIWRARREFFTGDFPCSTLVQVAGLADPDMLLEITVQAMAGSGDA